MQGGVKCAVTGAGVLLYGRAVHGTAAVLVAAAVAVAQLHR
jgi:hypothetical protein